MSLEMVEVLKACGARDIVVTVDETGRFRRVAWQDPTDPEKREALHQMLRMPAPAPAPIGKWEPVEFAELEKRWHAAAHNRTQKTGDYLLFHDCSGNGNGSKKLGPSFWITAGGAVCPECGTMSFTYPRRPAKAQGKDLKERKARLDAFLELAREKGWPTFKFVPEPRKDLN